MKKSCSFNVKQDTTEKVQFQLFTIFLLLFTKFFRKKVRLSTRLKWYQVFNIFLIFLDFLKSQFLSCLAIFAANSLNTKFSTPLKDPKNDYKVRQVLTVFFFQISCFMFQLKSWHLRHLSLKFTNILKKKSTLKQPKASDKQKHFARDKPGQNICDKT